MNANKAVELGFADDILSRDNDLEDLGQPQIAMMYERATVTNSLKDKIASKCRIQKKPEPEVTERSVDSLMERLNLIKNHI